MQIEPGPDTPSGPSTGQRPLHRTVLSTRRLEAYTDGVFAIAATLLAFNLSVNALGSVDSAAELNQRLIGLWPSLLNVVISFLLLGLLWLIHVRQFEHIPRVDTTIIWLNNLRLLGVVLMPFTTSLNDEFGDYLAGRLALPLNFLVILFFGTWQWFHASSPRVRLVHGLSAVAVHNIRVNAVSAVAQGVCVAVLAAFFGSVAFLVFALDPLIAMLLRRVGILRAGQDI